MSLALVPSPEPIVEDFIAKQIWQAVISNWSLI